LESLEVVAHPHFDKADEAWLTDIRSRRTGGRAAPYFTLVFGGAGLTAETYTAKITAAAREMPRIRFRLRSALVMPEPSVKRFHVFLIPDEGFGAILKLHDALHVGRLAAALRPDSPYLPHITAATTTDAAAARSLAFALNQRGGVDIHGEINALRIERREGETISLVAEAPLAKGGLFK
jgi:hypothetical protein